MTAKPYDEERQGEVLRSIARNNQFEVGRWTLSATQMKRAQFGQAIATQLFAAVNDWQHQPKWNWNEVEPFITQSRAGEQLRYAIHEPLIFLDLNGVPVALVSQPRPRQCDLKLAFRLMQEAGLFVEMPASTFASITEPGERLFLVCALRPSKLRWLPEQREANGPFSVHASEAPHFYGFLDQFRSSNSKIERELDRLRYYLNHVRRWAPPKHLMSLPHFNTYLWGCCGHSMDSEMSARIWTRYEKWRSRQVSLILQYNRDVAEIAL